MDWLDYSTRLMNARWRGRKVTQLTIGGGVTVAWSQVGESGARFRLEQGFEISDARTGLVAAIEPAHLERGAQAFVDLIWATVRAVRTEPGTVPIVEFEDGRTLRAGPHPTFESWSFVTDDRGLVVCMPGGEIAVWSPDGERASS